MLNFIDVSNWQSDLDVNAVADSVDAIVCKATEGTDFVDGYCDGFVQAAKSCGKQFGFYHFADDGNATQEADFFIENCEGYFGDGVPVLDWEGNQNVDWVNEFVRRVHDVKGVWCWIYANPWRFNQGGVEENCMRWVASYPSVEHPTFAQAAEWDAPEVEGFVGAWQFCSDGYVDGYNGELDCDVFYGDVNAWNAYAGKVVSEPSAEEEPETEPQGGSESVIVENSQYRVTIETK